MKKSFAQRLKSVCLSTLFCFLMGFALLLFIAFFLFPQLFGGVIKYEQGVVSNQTAQPVKKPIIRILSLLEKEAYDKKLDEVANNPILKTTPPSAPLLDQGGEGGGNSKESIPVSPSLSKPSLWPAKAVYPNAGAILPWKRIVAYYGNLYSKQMGVLGEYPETEMLSKLDMEVKKWELADPATPVVPALHYIAVVAQSKPGTDGKYRARMPNSEIDKVLAIAKKINGIVFLDLQVGFSTLQDEVPLLEKYLEMPEVHLGVDPEFSMKGKFPPGKVVGTFDAVDINFTANYLAKLVQKNDLTPKILVVHRYTEKMVTNYKEIKPLPEVQIIMDMDGWGTKPRKLSTYREYIYKQPVQFTGFKLFYKNDVWEKDTMLFTPSELLKLNPQPVYIQFQ